MPLEGAPGRTAVPSRGLILMLGLAIALNYVDRGAVSVAAPLIQSELGLSATGYGVIVSAFFWTYVPALLLAGWLADRMSVHRLMAVGVALWATATLLTGFAGGMLGLIVLRLVMGIGEGVAFPSASKLIAGVPDGRRATANVALSAGIALGPLIGTLAGGFILSRYGWRPMFLVFGVVTLLWLIPWSWQRDAIAPPAARHISPDTMPYPRLLRMPKLWAMSALHFTATYVLYFVLAWLPLYLVKVRGFDIAHMAMLTGLFYLMQALSGWMSAMLCDRLLAAGHEPTLVRRRMLFLSIALATIGVLAIPLASTMPVLVAVLVLTGVGFGPASMLLFTIGQTLAGPASAGRWIGVQASVGNLAGITGPVITGVIVDAVGYGPAFVLTAAINVAGVLIFALSVRRIEPVNWRTA